MRRAKVVVVGRGEAGKSTLIRKLAPRSLNLEVGGRTVALDHGMLVRDSGRISLVGVPGQDRFAAVREALVAGARAAVWVHPQGEEPDPGTAALLAGSHPGALPYIVYVNQRREGAPVPFRTPSIVPEPRHVLFGNLSSTEDNLEQLESLLWRLFTHVDSGSF